MVLRRHGSAHRPGGRNRRPPREDPRSSRGRPPRPRELRRAGRHERPQRRCSTIESATSEATSAAIALSAKVVVNADSAGTPLSPIVRAVKSAAPTWPPTTAPIIRTTVFIPVATPISVASTFSAISATIAAKANPTPIPSAVLAAITCHGSSFDRASASAAALTISMPPASGHLEPKRRPISPAAGPEKSIASDVGRRKRPGLRRARPEPVAARDRSLDERRDEHEAAEEREAGDHRRRVRQQHGSMREHPHVHHR